eukprot:1091052-Pelagomonas_calceolata.AAC.4
MGTIFFDLGHTWKETFSRAAMLFFIAVSPVSHLVQELWKSSLKGIWGALETKQPLHALHSRAKCLMANRSLGNWQGPQNKSQHCRLNFKGPGPRSKAIILSSSLLCILPCRAS